jgi:hypothetical protein
MVVVSEAPPVVPEANDRIVLLRTTKRFSFIGLGHIKAPYAHRHRFLQYEYVSVNFDTLLLDNPVPLEYVRSQTKLGPLGRGEYITGGDAPTEITQEQWEAITSICAQRESPTPPFMRWTIEPGSTYSSAIVRPSCSARGDKPRVGLGLRCPPGRNPALSAASTTHGGRSLPYRLEALLRGADCR